MARDLNGANDRISFGSDPSIGDHQQRTVLMWIMPRDSADAADDLLGKTDGGGVTPTGWQFSRTETVGVSGGHLELVQDWSITDGSWRTPLDGVPEGSLHHVGVTYNRAATGNDPVFYHNGTTPAVTELTPPAGNTQGDAADTLLAGEDGAGGNDYDGQVGWIIYDNTIFTAADVNRHRWWGVAPGGPSTVDVWHPMWTDDLTNKGTATANATPTGTTMVGMPRVERMWAGCLGVGR